MRVRSYFRYKSDPARVVIQLLTFLRCQRAFSLETRLAVACRQTTCLFLGGLLRGLARAGVSAAPLRRVSNAAAGRVYDAGVFWGQVSSLARTGQLGSICIAILLHRWYSPPPSPSDLRGGARGVGLAAAVAAPHVAPDHGMYLPVLSTSLAHRGGAQSRRVILGVSLPSTPSSHSCSSRSTNSERGSSRQRSSSW